MGQLDLFTPPVQKCAPIIKRNCDIDLKGLDAALKKVNELMALYKESIEVYRKYLGDENN